MHLIMKEKKHTFKLQTSNNGELTVALTEGKPLFVLGANGVGKSTLMHKIFEQNFNNTKRILAHRQTWFRSNTMDLTASNKKQQDEYIKNTDLQIDSRWKDDYSDARSSISIFELINSENIRSRRISNAVDAKDIDFAKKLSNTQAPLQAINELLAISNIPVLITLGKDEQLFASKNGCEPYSIAELSDGERNALLICADVLTTEPNHIIVLDEPERHLHRSIISPLLSSLILKRKDCSFVISTHDVHLPLDHPDASVLLLRNCQWNNKEIKDWDADLISEADDIPIPVKREILGSKRNILFVEGTYDSLDRQLYQLIFPEVTVMPQGSCSKVEKAVEGIKGTENLHWINAYGLIDADDRTPEQIEKLLKKRVAALKSYSIESLYYNLEIVKKIVERQTQVTGESEDIAYKKAIEKIITDITPHKERLCSRLCEKKVRIMINNDLPKHTDIVKRKIYKVNIDLNKLMETEEEIFDNLISHQDLNGLISRYPVRETPVLNNIASGCGFTQEKYESSVRKMIVDNEDIRIFYQDLLQPLTKLMGLKKIIQERIIDNVESYAVSKDNA